MQIGVGKIRRIYNNMMKIAFVGQRAIPKKGNQEDSETNNATMIYSSAS